MASKFPVCRVCSTSTSTESEATTTRRCRQLFGNMGIKDQLPGRLSVALDLPVSPSDGLSNLVCISCINKVESLEAFRLLARQSYHKQLSKENLPPLLGGGTVVSPVRPPSKKRTKDTSGTGASPFTVSSRPSAKRSTMGVGGRRLAFSPAKSRVNVNASIYIYQYTFCSSQWWSTRSTQLCNVTAWPR